MTRCNMVAFTAVAMLGGVPAAGPALAAPFNDLFVFGDSYSDTGAFFPLTNGSTAAGYLAQDLGVRLATPQNPHPGTDGVNFAESGARVDVGPTPPNTHPLSLTQQVGEFQNYVTSGNLTFQPSRTLFFLAGGLNDHTAPAAGIGAATAAQVATLYSLGARYFEIALLPSLVPAFADSAANLNPEYTALVPQLQAEFPDAVIHLSDWGPDYGDILTNPSKYGITNTTDPCLSGFGPTATVCSTPDQYFYYVIVHPSDAAHHIVGDELYLEALTLVPEPASLSLLCIGLVGLAAGVRRRRRADTST